MHIMIDVETLACTPCACIWAIGWAKFDIDSIYESDTILLRPPVDSKAFDVDADTLAFTIDNSAALFSEALRCNVMPVVAAYEVAGLIDGCDEIWANGPAFDLVILRNMMENYSVQAPWSYRQERDVRTLKSMAGVEAVPSRVPHHPMHDAIAQVHTVWAALNKMKGTNHE